MKTNAISRVRVALWTLTMCLAVSAKASVHVALVADQPVVSSGAEFQVRLQVTQAAGAFNGYRAVIEFDPQALTFVSNEEGAVMTDPPSCGTTFNYFTAEDSSVAIEHVILCGPDVSLVGPGDLYVLRFQATGTNQMTPISFRELEVFRFGSLIGVTAATDACVQIGSPQVAEISATPMSHDYADVTAGASVLQTFSVQNDGTASLSVSSTTLVGLDASEFSIGAGGGSFVLAPGQNQDVEVSFNPTTTGPKSASLRIHSNDPCDDAIDIALSGTGVAATDAPQRTVSPYAPRLRVAPNPFNPSTVIQIETTTAGTQSLEIHDARGHRVRTMQTGSFGTGLRSITWDGADDDGSRLGSGVYLVTLRSDHGAATQRVVLLK